MLDHWNKDKDMGGDLDKQEESKAVQIRHRDYPIWEVIQRGNGPVSVLTDTNGLIKVLPPKTAEEILARERERKARTTLLMALPEDHLAKFHKMTDAKEMWEAIKSRFGGNDESKKMQKYILKQQFEGFSVSNSEGLHKGYDRFQSLLSQLEIHGAGVSTEDANQKFLRSLPSAWSQVSLIMRTKPGVDSLSFDDLYNNLRVFESDVKGSTASSSSTQNVAFVSENTSISAQTQSHLSARDKAGLGYGDQMNKVGMHAYLLLSMTRIYIPSGPDKEIDDSQFTYGPKQSKPSKKLLGKLLKNKTHVSESRPDKKEFVVVLLVEKLGYPQRPYKTKGLFDSGCTQAHDWKQVLPAKYQDFNGGPVAFLRKNYSISINFSGEQIVTRKQGLLCTAKYVSYTSTVKSSKAKNTGEEPNKNPDLKTDEKPIDKEDQVFLDGLEKLKRQEHDANRTNTVNTAITPVSTASPYGGLSFTDTDQMILKYISLEDMYDHPTMCIFTNVDNSIQPYTLILRDPKLSSSNKEQRDQKLWSIFFGVGGLKPFRSYLPLLLTWIQSYQMDVKSASRWKNNRKSGYKRGTIDKTLFIKKDKNDIMLVQVYVDDIIFGSTKRSWCDEFEALMKSRFQMSSLGELTSSWITSTLKAKPKTCGFWYPRVSSFDLEAYSNSDYARTNLDKKSTIGGCQFLGMRLISWQCKKQTIVATSTTEAEYVAAANCCGQVCRFQNQR
ncbi:ribonuclease H-like domain-containing protein [Tanacetum coccineum]